MLSTKEKSEIIKIINDVDIWDLNITDFVSYESKLKKEISKIASKCDDKTKNALMRIKYFITTELREAMYGNIIDKRHPLDENLLDKDQTTKNLKKLERSKLKEVLNEVKKSDELEDMAGKIELAFKSKMKEFGNIK